MIKAVTAVSTNRQHYRNLAVRVCVTYTWITLSKLEQRLSPHYYSSEHQGRRETYATSQEVCEMAPYILRSCEAASRKGFRNFRKVTMSPKDLASVNTKSNLLFDESL
ncbi:hypothetical protein J6590_065953 [Homalodisca vitripennis]|nr:hypothetical protein J6590_065953 [Homalodisca vitripennis]